MLYPIYEQELLKQGYQRVVGIDEVGRGCLAGPVAVGAYIYSNKSQVYDGIKDSKSLSEKKRNTLHELLSQDRYQIFYGEPTLIDEINILAAVEKLIADAVEELQDGKTYFLIDGRFTRNFDDHSEQIIKGDDTHYSIGAAAILAKVERDRLMLKLHDRYPQYGFDKHKGYGTKQHRMALIEYGPCDDIHRFSYQPVFEAKELHS